MSRREHLIAFSPSTWRAAAWLVAALLVTSGCATPPDEVPRPAPLISKGEAVARETCGECHDVSDAGPSPLADAPSFRTLRTRYSRDQFAALLTTRMAEVHFRMPKLRLDEDEVEALLDYLAPHP